MTDLTSTKVVTLNRNSLCKHYTLTGFLNSRSAVQSCPRSPSLIYSRSTTPLLNIQALFTHNQSVSSTFTRVGLGKHWESTRVYSGKLNQKFRPNYIEKFSIESKINKHFVGASYGARTDNHHSI